jgi:hypothetical protein
LKDFKSLPLLEEVRFNKVNVVPEAAAALHVCLLTKKSMTQVLLFDTKVDRRVASTFVRLLKADSDNCHHLREICLFGKEGLNTEIDWKLDTDFELDEWAKVNRARISVHEFMEHIVTRDRDPIIANDENKFVDDMDWANYYDGNDEANDMYSPNHLYELLRAKPQFMRLT